MELPRAYGGPAVQGELKCQPSDFRVQECMHVQPEGEGEHLWLEIEKTGWNTEDVAMWLAKSAGIHRLSVGYSGLKDKHAVTQQWFSLHLPGKADPQICCPDGLRILQQVRHRRKLNRGTHRANAFQLIVRNVVGDVAQLETQIDVLSQQGVPNYFGEQRFGRGAGNLVRGREWLCGGEAPRKKALRSIWLSAVRSDCFNRVLAERVRLQRWNALLDGDIFQPEGSRGLFHAADEDNAVARLEAGEIHPTAPLPGITNMASSGACLALEERVLADDSAVIEGLCHLGVDGARRATRLPVSDLQWQLNALHEPEDTLSKAPVYTLSIQFVLPAGAFATTVMAELVAPPTITNNQE